MKFPDIKPFIRYAHYLPLNNDSDYPPSIAYDNRLFYIHSGCGSISVEDVVYNMKKGDVLFFPSGKKYHILTPPEKAVYIGINYDYTQANIIKSTPIPPAEYSQYDSMQKLENVIFEDLDFLENAMHITNMSGISHKFLKLVSEYSQKLIYHEEIASTIFTEILLECIRKKDTQKLTGSKDILNTLIGYINENYNKPLTNKTIGEKLNLHPNYVNTLIKSYTGLSLHQYLLKVKVSYSIEYLDLYPIGEIAERCGFTSIHHFSKTFKKIMGVPPSSYKKITQDT